ncbi:cupredoxin domain-containing protein [Streptomyces sp. NPDC058960]|uniref:cupredoxin domain-containing protein n=1 Tax=Streptomyces sp. NPDC058960 TaxID=3346679 RepID=UPI0036852698
MTMRLQRMFSSGRRRHVQRGRPRATAAVAALSLSLLGVGLTAPPASAATYSVSLKNLQYNPPTLDVQVGDSVTWSNDETNGVTHSVTGGDLNSPDLAPGAKYSFTFSSPGTFSYHCRFHPDMQGTVVVGGSSSSPSPTSSATASPTASPTPSGSASPTPSPSSSSTATSPAPTSSGGGAPVGAGPLPVSFHLNDTAGSWYNTNLSLFGTKSLAVAELPRVPLSSASAAAPTSTSGGLLGGTTSTVANTTSSLLGGALGTGALSGTDALNLLNGDLQGLQDFTFNTASAPNVGQLGVDPLKLLGLDSLKSSIATILPSGDPRVAKATSLLDELGKEMAAQPANAPTSLSSLPVSADLLPLLSDIQKWAATNDITLPVTANFDISAPAAMSAHTVSSLIWPDGAKGFPFDQPGAWVGQTSVQLTKPGLYAFACKIHPMMLGAIVVDDPLTPGLDFGQKLRVNGRALNVPSDADVIAELVDKFFNITTPGNWQRYSNTEAKTWNPSFPPAPILMYGSDGKQELVPSLDAYLKNKFNTPKTLPALTQRPSTPGVGEVWVDTEFERLAGKTKPGTATKVNVENWTVDRKVSLPQINMNNPHNMWTDRDEKYIYQTEWFGNKLDVFDRKTGQYVRQVEVGPDPAHVMSRTDTDQLHVSLNGGGAVMEVAPGGTGIDRRIPVQSPGEPIANPHAHWMSADAKTMVTPNTNTNDTSIVDIPSGTFHKDVGGELPLATGMMPDASKAYVANFLSNTVSCISLKADACEDGSSTVHHKEIDLWKNYDPVKGAIGPFGGLPIQLPVSPDGKAVLVANTLTSNISVIDTKTDQVIKYLPCDSGCHGINFGAKKGGGYYAYVASKFSNAMEIVDIDPNGDGDISDAKVVGHMVLDPSENTAMDDTIVGDSGIGGTGVLPIPLVYNGWSQHVPSNAVNDQLTCRQRNPITYGTDCP